MLNMKVLLLFTLVISLQSCGSMFDLAGKGAKTKCLKLSTESMTIDCSCGDKRIVSLTIYNHTNAEESFGPRTTDLVFKPAVRTLSLPVNKDSADRHFLQIEIHLTDSYHRESYYFWTKPGDFSRTQNMYARYFGH